MINTISMFHPYIPDTAIEEILKTLNSKWIGQGPKVDEFEKEFKAKFFENEHCVAVGAGTDALHLAYILAGIKKGDEVIVPVLTCAATNIPLLYCGATIRFADVDPQTLNIDVNHVKSLITEKTKAIVCVHYGGCPCDMDALSHIAKDNGLIIIEDAAHALGGIYHGKPIGTLSDFAAFSFQAIKHITTGDGGMLVVKNPLLAEKARRLRWFGIDRKAKLFGNWTNDINEIGYKYQMTDLGATIGLASLRSFDTMIAHRKLLFDTYIEHLQLLKNIKLVGIDIPNIKHAMWLFTLLSDRREQIETELKKIGIESGQVHYRNDTYTIFKDFRQPLPNMDALQDLYLSLPLHNRMTVEDVEKICIVIKHVIQH